MNVYIYTNFDLVKVDLGRFDEKQERGIRFLSTAMAARHLTDTRLGFFSGAVFIVLATLILAFSYFSVRSVPPLVIDATRIPVQESSSVNHHNYKLALNCSSKLHEVYFTERLSSETEVNVEEERVTLNDTDLDHWDWTWKQELRIQCHFKKFAREEAIQLLRGTWIVVAGDSQARLLFVALLELLLPSIEELRPQLFKRHSNFEYMLEEQQMRLEFVWAPYAANLTAMASEFGERQVCPDVLIMGAGLWHMLHVGDHNHYGSSLSELQRALRSLPMHHKNVADKDLPAKDLVLPQMFWMSLPTLIPSLLQSEVKQKQMTTYKQQVYSREMLESQLLHPKGVAMLLDIQKLSHRCGPRCSHDGIHYSQAIYQAALQVLINSLLSSPMGLQ